MYIDGSSVGNTSTSYDATNAINGILIGTFNDALSLSPNGYIDELRITKGVARYTSNFTPSTQPFGGFSNSKYTFSKISADPNTSLLLHMDGANGSQSFTDYSSNNFTITANGNAQISTSIKKFGNGSAYFDGSGDYLVLEDDADFNLASTPFTIEAWVYPTVVDSTVRAIISKDTYGINFSWCIAFDNTNLIFVTKQANDNLRFTASVTPNTWQHVAVTHDGANTLRFFLNGTMISAFTDIHDGNFDGVVTNSPADITIGCFGWNQPSAFYQGYIDELRVIKGVVKYTSNFTPIEVPFGISNSKYRFIKKIFPIEGLVAFWNFNENNTDASFGDPSYFLTNPGSITYSAGKVGGGINLPAGSRIRVDENLWDMVASPTSYSVAFWVKKNAISPSPQGAVIAGSLFGPMNFHFSFGIVINGSNSSFENGITYGQVTGATQYTYINAPFSINLGEWIHVVGTYDLGTSTRKLYVNGNLIETQNGITPPTSVLHDSWNGFAINGSTIGTNSSEYGGDHSFDAFGLWSRALTNVEIAALYNNGNGAES
jgi:hypothetical protein